MRTVKAKVFTKFVIDLTNKKFVRTKEQATKEMVKFANEHFEMEEEEIMQIINEHAQVRASWKFANDTDEMVRFLILDFARHLFQEVKRTKANEFILETQEAEALIDNFREDDGL